MPGFAHAILKRALASDLLRAEISGRAHRLTGDEAKRLADSVLERFGVPIQDGTQPRDDIARLTAASWLGLGEQLNVPLGPAAGHGKKLSVTRFRLDDEGYEELVPAHLPPAPGQIRDVFDLSWTVSLGGCSGAFTLSGLGLSSQSQKSGGEDLHDRLLGQFAEAAKGMGADAARAERAREATARSAREGGLGGEGGGEEVDWKGKYLAMEFSARVAKGEMDRVRERMLEKVLDAVM